MKRTSKTPSRKVTAKNGEEFKAQKRLLVCQTNQTLSLGPQLPGCHHHHFVQKIASSPKELDVSLSGLITYQVKRS